MQVGDLIQVVDSDCLYYGQLGLIVKVDMRLLLPYLIMINNGNVVYYANCHINKL